MPERELRGASRAPKRESPQLECATEVPQAVPARFVLIDQSLRDNQGHHYSYASAVAQAAQSLGYHEIIVANRALALAVQRESEQRSLSMRGWFTESWTESFRGTISPASRLERSREWIASALRSRPALYVPIRRFYGAVRYRGTRGLERPVGRFGVELAALLRSLGLGPRDHVFIPTLSTMEASDCFRVVADASRDSLPLIHVLFRRDPEENPVRYSPAGSFADLLRSIQDSEVHRRALRFYTDTRDLSNQYSRMSKFSFETLPIPVRPMAASGPERTSSARIKITYFGDARSEKGFQLLPGLVRETMNSPIANRVEFVIQATPAQGSRDESGMGAARELLRRQVGSGLQLLEEPLSDDEYGRRLRETDAIIIPYQALPYRWRSSGVLAEALVAGKPVLVPHDTWMAREADEDSSVRFRGTKQLFPALCELVAEFPRLRQAALARTTYWRQRHDPLTLVRALVSPSSAAALGSI